MRFLQDDHFEVPANSAGVEEILSIAIDRTNGLLREHEVYQLLRLIGIATPSWYFHNIADAGDDLQSKLPHAGPFVAKVVVRDLTHKTELKGLAFNVTSDNAQDAVESFRKRFAKLSIEGVLFAEQVGHDIKPGGEMLIGLYQDPFFGPCLSLGFGGTQAQHLKEIMRPQAAQIIIPTTIDLMSIEHILRHVPVVGLMEGKVRGWAQRLDYEDILRALISLQRIGRYYSAQNPKSLFVIEELEANPAVAADHKVVALDGVLRTRRNDRTPPHPKPIGKIRKLLAPDSVAIAGVSAKDPRSLTNILLKNFLTSPIPHNKVYIIHPKEDQIEGIKCFRDINTMLHERQGVPVDCLVVGVPARIAGQMVQEAFDSYCAHTIQIIAAGFGETQGGKAMQHDLVQRLAHLDATPEKRPLINGPNTLGNVYRGRDTLFRPSYKSSSSGKGRRNCALICQSGAFMITRVSDWADVIAPEITVSVGNQMDLSVADFLEYLLGEEDITSYGLYIEGLNPGDGIKLMRLIEAAQSRDRFVVIYKAGRTEAGMTAARGHTAAMAGDYEMFANLMHRAGAMVAETFEEFDNLMMLTTYCKGLAGLMKLPAAERVGVAALSNAGFEKCAIADQLTALSPGTAKLAPLSQETRDRIEAIFVDHGMSGIMDIHDVLDLSPMMNDEGYEKIIRATLTDENVDFGIYSIVPETVNLNTCKPADGHDEDMSREGSILNRLIHIRRDVHKPFVVSFESGKQYNRLRALLLEAGIPCFPSADAAARAVAKCIDAIRRDVV